jgi:hypothetical protein
MDEIDLPILRVILRIAIVREDASAGRDTHARFSRDRQLAGMDGRYPIIGIAPIQQVVLVELVVYAPIHSIGVKRGDRGGNERGACAVVGEGPFGIG